MNKVIAFDLDGTLVNSALHLLPAYHESLAQLHYEIPPDDTLLQCIGGTVEDNYKRIMPQCSWETFYEYELLVAKNAAKYAKTNGMCYPHIKESLDALRKNGYLTVLCSNGSKEYIFPLIEVLELREHLDYVHALTTEKNKTELLASLISKFDSLGNTAMVGDRHFDAQAAHDNGVPFIGCRYGLFPTEIDEAHPEAILNDPSELLEAAQRLLGY